MKTKKYLNTKEYLYLIRTREHFNKNNIIVVMQENRIKFVVGVVLFGFGLVSIPIPFITIPIIMFSCGLMGVTIQDIRRKRKEIKNTFKYKYMRYIKNK